MAPMRNAFLHRGSQLHHLCTKSFAFHQEFTRGHAHAASHGRLAEQEHDPETGVLTLAQRCKNLLAANWRGQLTSLKPKLSDENKKKDVERTHGSLTNFLLVNGTAVVWLPEDSAHCLNLLLDNRASFIVGHTDPAPLMKAFRQVKKTPRHAVLVGTLAIPEDDESLGVEYVRETLNEMIMASELAVKQASPAFKGMLEASGHVLKKRMQALTSMLDSKGEDAFYQLDASSCHFVDVMGTRYPVDLMDTFESVPDPMSPLLAVILEGINQSSSRRLGLRLLCAWYLRVKVEDAYVFSADRWGLNVLTKIVAGPNNIEVARHTTSGNKVGKASDSDNSDNFEWRDLRLDFKEEVKDLDEFCLMLGKMERESLVGFSKAKAKVMGARGPGKPTAH